MKVKGSNGLTKSQELALRIDSFPYKAISKDVKLNLTGRWAAVESVNADGNLYEMVLIETKEEGWVSISGDVAMEGIMTIIETVANEEDVNYDDFSIEMVSIESTTNKGQSYNKIMMC